MFPIQDQVSAAAKSSFANGFEVYSNLAAKTFEGMEKLINLNLTATKASLDEAAAASRQLLGAKDAQEFMALLNAQTKPNLDKAVSYGSHLANIAVALQSEYGKAAETRLAQIARQFSELVDEAGKNAPAGSETFVSFMKSTLGNASNGYEQFTKTAKQAVDAMEANLNTAVGLVTPATTGKTTVKA